MWWRRNRTMWSDRLAGPVSKRRPRFRPNSPARFDVLLCHRFLSKVACFSITSRYIIPYHYNFKSIILNRGLTGNYPFEAISARWFCSRKWLRLWASAGVSPWLPPPRREWWMRSIPRCGWRPRTPALKPLGADANWWRSGSGGVSIDSPCWRAEFPRHRKWTGCETKSTTTMGQEQPPIRCGASDTLQKIWDPKFSKNFHN